MTLRVWRWYRSRGKLGSYFRKSLILILCIASIPTALIGMGAYLLGTKQIESEVHRSHQEQLTKAMERIDEDLAQLEIAAVQWSLDPIFDESVKSIDFRQDFRMTHSLYSKLSLIKNPYPYLSEVQLYIDQSLPIIITEEKGIIPVSGDVGETYSSMLQAEENAYWVESMPFPTGAQREIALVQKLGYGQNAYGLLIIYLNAGHVERVANDFFNGTNGTALLLGGQGEFVIYSGAASGSAPTPFEEALRELSQSYEEVDNVAFTYHWEGETYSVSYGTFKRLGAIWTYVAATSLSQLTEPVLVMSRLILGVSVLGLVVALLLAWIGSKSLYRPIRRLVGMFQDQRQPAGLPGDEIAFIEMQWDRVNSHSKVLQEEVTKSQPLLRYGFLLQFAQGHYHALKEEEIRDRLEAFGLNTADRGFVLMHVQLNDLMHPEKRFTEDDGPLVTFAATNILEELLESKERECAVVNMQDLSIRVLLTFDMRESREKVKAELFRIAEQWIDVLGRLLKMQVIVAVSRPTTQAKNIPVLFAELRQVVRYRDLQREGQIIDMEDIVPEKKERSDYPFELEAATLEAVKLGIRDEAEARLREFADALIRRAGQEYAVQQGIVQLFGSMQRIIIEAGLPSQTPYDGVDGLEQLLQLKEPTKMVEYLEKSILAPYMDGIEKDQQRHRKQLVDRATDYLQSNFTNEVSLESCAEWLGVSKFALSRAFKQTTGINFIDYVTRLRVEKAKEMLRGTDWKVADIAERIGYQPSHFSRLFRKLEGVTPGQYRDSAPLIVLGESKSEPGN